MVTTPGTIKVTHAWIQVRRKTDKIISQELKKISSTDIIHQKDSSDQFCYREERGHLACKSLATNYMPPQGIRKGGYITAHSGHKWRDRTCVVQ